MKQKRWNPVFLSGLGDLQRLWANKPMRLGMIGLLLIPLMYSAIYLSAFYDPYENLQYLPVALVNEDLGAVQNGERINAGNELVKELQEDSQVKWEFVSRAQMNEGLNHGIYYIGIVVPENFSKAIVSVDESNPSKGKIEYHVDESNNYLSGTIGKSIRRELEIKLDQKLTRIYVEKIFVGISKSADDLQKAADGAGLLTEKIGEAAGGSKTVHESIRKLETGAGTIEQNLVLLNQKLAQARAEIDKIPFAEIEKAQKIIHQANDEIQRIANIPLPDTPPDLGSFLRDSQNSLEEAGKQIHGTETDLNRLVKEHPELANDAAVLSMKNSLNKAQKIHRSETARFNQIRSKLPDWERAWKVFINTRAKIAADANRLTGRMDQLTVKANELKGAANQLVEATSRLADGQHQLASGLGQLETGTGKLHQGLDKIRAGEAELQQGLSEGVQKAKEQLQGTAEKEKAIADPVDINENIHHAVPNYATGFAPYFISLSLWVGAMLLFTVVDLYQVLDDRKQPLSMAASGLIGIGQAVLLVSTIVFILKIEPILPVWLYLFSFLMALTFIALNQTLIVYLGNVGRFLSIAILMLQLASSAGTYPKELLPPFFQAIGDYLPMTYTVQGLRAVLSNGNMNTITHCMYILLGFMTISLLLTRLHLQLGKPLVKRTVKVLKTKLNHA
ncbi:YhgE/Pip domain-containing protein [Thermoactinomyces mirandus]|uniref:YhgE/Pip domain-containing protein n=1 Tax=Thermoactinomyces mirandus TaxID=2756294 RepID=A0A7W1XTE9_9BACL|nr:YhgE/Pip domain-containing protein [Thermoactinomyces mirandus]MBA4602831.1 YhgE/Pip domain-containing protein [Thermoactinomyces mirandus]